MTSKTKSLWRVAISILAFMLSASGVHAQEVRIDRPGKDYRNFDLPAADPELCRKACDDDASCKPYTYVRPGVQGSNVRCWLKKSDVSATVENDRCVSGVA